MPSLSLLRNLTHRSSRSSLIHLLNMVSIAPSLHRGLYIALSPSCLIFPTMLMTIALYYIRTCDGLLDLSCSCNVTRSTPSRTSVYLVIICITLSTRDSYYIWASIRTAIPWPEIPLLCRTRIGSLLSTSLSLELSLPQLSSASFHSSTPTSKHSPYRTKSRQYHKRVVGRVAKR